MAKAKEIIVFIILYHCSQLHVTKSEILKTNVLFHALEQDASNVILGGYGWTFIQVTSSTSGCATMCSRPISFLNGRTCVGFHRSPTTGSCYLMDIGTGDVSGDQLTGKVFVDSRFSWNGISENISSATAAFTAYGMITSDGYDQPTTDKKSTMQAGSTISQESTEAVAIKLSTTG